MRNLKIGFRLGLGFGLVIIVLVIISSINVLSSINSRNMEALTIKRQATNDAALRWSKYVELNANQVLARTSTQDPTMLEIFKERMQDSYKQATKYRDRVNNLLFTDEAKLLFQDALKAQQEYIEPRDAALIRLDNGDMAGTIDFFRYEMPPLAVNYFNKIELLSSFLTDQLEKQTVLSQQVAQRDLVISIVLSIIAVLLGLFFGAYITRSITAPLKKALALAKEVANKDLTHQLIVKGKDEVSELSRALNEMIISLRNTVGEVHIGANTIALAASQITAGNLDLAARTEQQSSSLAETAASMEQLTSTVGQNAENSQQANQLAETAASSAAESGSMVNNLVGTMSEINEKSQQMAEIVAVIDSIAFQTNILALNAAVEAARAGEQGRGFAVVASEVRALAQRSAASAKEIKLLIDAAVTATHQGNEQASLAGNSVESLVQDIHRVSGIMNEISAASVEQTTGIEQVNIAVTQMDDVTRQNASLVDESAAAASSLSEQAKTLAQMVSMFKLNQSDQDNQSEQNIPSAPTKLIRPKIDAKAKPAERPALTAPANEKPGQWEEF